MNKVPFVVVYKKPKGRKYFLKTLYVTLEDIIDGNKRKPPIPHEFELIEIGWGTRFIKDYMEEYNITKIEDNE